MFICVSLVFFTSMTISDLAVLPPLILLPCTNFLFACIVAGREILFPPEIFLLQTCLQIHENKLVREKKITKREKKLQKK